MPAVVSLQNPDYSQNPVNYAFSLGNTSTQVLPFNALRRRVIFHNPNTTALIAICCLVDNRGNALAASVISPGSIILLPRTTFDLDNSPVSGWNAISDGSGGLSILEFF